MKTKSAHCGVRGRPPKQKTVVKSEMESPDGLTEVGFQNAINAKPSVEIVSCISYQKFRYSGENRPGKKYQEKDFMELKLTNLGDKVVRVVIICTDAENKELIHPNGLVGKDCHDGIYDKEYAVTKQKFQIKIPYLRTERIKTKKNEHSKIRDILKGRAEHLPSPYRERCESQCTDQYTFNRKFDTTKVCLGVIVTVRSHFEGAVNGSLHAISHVVNNASEKTSLSILKLSNSMFSASKGGLVDVFTTEDGPAIEKDEYVLYVTYENDDGVVEWESERYSPSPNEILYKRIISYTVPPFATPDITQDVEAVLHLDCPQSNQSCEKQILYSPHEEDLVFYEPHLKRSYTEELGDVKPAKRLKPEKRQGSAAVKALKETLKNRDTEHRNSLPPNVQIIQSSEESALVRRSEPHLVPEDLNHNVTHTILTEEHGNQEFQNLKVLAAAYSKSVPSNTVLIITNDGPEDIENVINKGVSFFEKPAAERENKEQMIFIDSSNEQAMALSTRDGHQVILVPDSRSGNVENIAKEQPKETVSLAKDEVLQMVSENKVAHSDVLSKRVYKKSHKTDSPWAVGSDDEADDALLFGGLPFGKQPMLSKISVESHGSEVRIPQSSIQVSKKEEPIKNVPVETESKQKTISILSSKGDGMVKVIRESESSGKSPTQAEAKQLDFSKMSLPSDLNLSSELISNFPLVKDVNNS